MTPRIRTLSTVDMTLEEQKHVRRALNYLRHELGGWNPTAKALHFEETTLIKAGKGQRTVMASMAFRIARLAGVKIDDLLEGKWPPPGMCPNCGYRENGEDE